MKKRPEKKYPSRKRVFAIRDGKVVSASVVPLDPNWAVEVVRSAKFYRDPSVRLHKTEALFESMQAAARALKGKTAFWVHDDKIIPVKDTRDRSGDRSVYDMRGNAVSIYNIYDTRAEALRVLKKDLRESIKNCTKVVKKATRRLATVK